MSHATAALAGPQPPLHIKVLSRLKQDGQDEQDEQDEGAKVWKTLMSIEPHPQHGEKVREDLNVYNV